MLPSRFRLHLFALSSFAVAQPLYDLIGRNAEFLVAHRAGPAVIGGLVALLSFGIPAVLVVVVELLSRISPRLGSWLHRALVAVLVALIAATAARPLPAPIAVGVSAACGLAAAALYAVPVFRTFLTVTSPAVVIFPLVFVLATPAGRLVAPRPAQHGSTALRHTPPIVIIVFDELDTLSLLDGNGDLDANRYPNLAALARTASWFPNAVATYPYTPLSLPGIVTGVSTSIGSSRLPIAADYPDNLFTWLGSSYGLHVSEPFTSLCPRRLCEASAASRTDVRRLAADLGVLYLHLVMPRALADSTLPSLAFAWRGFGSVAKTPAAAPASPPQRDLLGVFQRAAAENRVTPFRTFIREIQPGPVLHFAHVLLPHDPYEYMPSCRRYLSDGRPAGMSPQGVWTGDRTLIEIARQRHVAQAGCVDTLVGELVAHLRSRDLFDDTLLIVTSDHGAAFEPGESHRALTATNYRGIIAAPLFVKLPHQRSGGVDERRVSGRDIVPTIADALGAVVPWKVDGQSIFTSTFPERATLEYAGAGSPLRAFDVREQARTSEPDSTGDDALIGRRLTDLPLLPDAPGTYVLSRSFRAFTSPPPDGLLPTLVHGRIERDGPGEGPIRLAIAVNGVVQAVTRTSEWSGVAHYFMALVPESAVRAGANRLDVLAVEGASLAQLSSELADGLSIERDARGETLVTSGGRRIPIEPHVTGIVDRVDQHADGLSLHGWVVDGKSAAAARAVVVFAGGSAVSVTSPIDPRPDVIAALKLPAATKVSYGLKLLRPDLERGTIRVFGISADEVAGELSVNTTARQVLARWPGTFVRR